MKPLPKNILIGVLIVVAIAGLFLLGALFGGRKNNDEKYRDLYINELKEKSALLSEKAEALELVIVEKDKKEVVQMQRDSAINAHFIENQKIYQSLHATLKEIPTRIARIAGNDDSIRSAFAR